MRVDVIVTIFRFQCTKNQDFFSKCDQIRSFLRIWSNLLKKSLMENFIFCAMFKPDNIESTKYIHKQIICSKTAVQTFFKNCRKVSETSQDKLIKSKCLLPASLLKSGPYFRFFFENIQKQNLKYLAAFECSITFSKTFCSTLIPVTDLLKTSIFL